VGTGAGILCAALPALFLLKHAVSRLFSRENGAIAWDEGDHIEKLTGRRKQTTVT
jgi:hypothetical protein